MTIRTNQFTGRRIWVGPPLPKLPTTQQQKDREQQAADELIVYIRSLPVELVNKLREGNSNAKHQTSQQ